MRRMIIGFLLLGLAIAGMAFSPVGTDILRSKTPVANVVVYKSPTCGCCVQYIKYLKQHNYSVEVIATDDMEGIRTQYNIPDNMSSCHTMTLGNYFVEGHIPLEVIDKLVAEQPSIDGISLPDMPAGSPGMPGAKTEPFVVYALTNGIAKEFSSV